jgi:hypothetical protein
MSQPLLSKSSIFEAKDLQHEDVPVPEWGGTVRMRQMNASEIQKFTEVMSVETNAKDGMFWMLIFCAVDESGEHLFTEEDLPQLRTKNMGILNKLQRIGLDLNKLTAAGRVALKKDSSEAPTDASPTV